MSTSIEKKIISSHWEEQSEIIQWLWEKWWKIIKNTAWWVFLILSSVNVNAQANNWIWFVNNLPQLSPWQTLEVIIDQNGWWQVDFVQTAIEWTFNANLERWVFISWNRQLAWSTMNNWLVTWVQWDKMIARGISTTWNNPCWNQSWEDNFEWEDWLWNTANKMVCVMAQILPVKLINFIAECEKDGQQVRLNRGTASEVNNKGFWIQKSADWNNWNNIAFVEWIGNSWAINNYSFIDTEWTEWDDDGVVYYRLEQKDFDATTNYSDVVSLRDCNSGNEYEVSLSPNPVSDILTVSINTSDREQAQTIYIMNSLSQVIWKVAAGDANKVEIDMSASPSGTYIIKTIAGNGADVVTKQVVKI